MAKDITDFIIHVHRQALHSPDPKKWYVHLGVWGPDPRAFVDIVCNVPIRTVLGGLDPMNAQGLTQAQSCGCANAWLEGKVSVKNISMSEDFSVLTLGTK